jgi:hypothetical protein
MTSTSSLQLHHVTVVYLGRYINNVLATEPLDNPEYDKPYFFYDLHSILIQSNTNNNIFVLFDGQENELMTNQLYVTPHLCITIIFIQNPFLED